MKIETFERLKQLEKILDYSNNLVELIKNDKNLKIRIVVETISSCKRKGSFGFLEDLGISEKDFNKIVLESNSKLKSEFERLLNE